MTFDEWVTKNARPRVEDDSGYSDEENGQYYWGLHKQYNQYVKEWKDQMFVLIMNPGMISLLNQS